MVIIPVGIAICLLVAVAAFLWPRRSWLLQGRVDGALLRVEEESDVAERPARALRTAVDASAETARAARGE
ncbi:MAG TPA: hypothetical protein VFN74_16525 [Chloroflexota bacterium]|nr:hypothetical protein [Chloroflexota bacterium]